MLICGCLYAPLPCHGFRDGGYSREAWGRWKDFDHDCQNTRAEILIRDSLVPVKFATERHCRVVSGMWICPYTGHVIFDSSDIDIDHVVPLAYAWYHGGSRWARGIRVRFANDPDNLLAVENRINRSKGSRGIRKWLPPRKDYRGKYIALWHRIQKKYRLVQ